MNNKRRRCFAYLLVAVFTLQTVFNNVSFSRAEEDKNVTVEETTEAVVTTEEATEVATEALVEAENEAVTEEEQSTVSADVFEMPEAEPATFEETTEEVVTTTEEKPSEEEKKQVELTDIELFGADEIFKQDEAKEDKEDKAKEIIEENEEEAVIDKYMDGEGSSIVVPAQISAISILGSKHVNNVHFIAESAEAFFTITKDTIDTAKLRFIIYDAAGNVVKDIPYADSYYKVKANPHQFLVPFKLDAEGEYTFAVQYEDTEAGQTIVMQSEKLIRNDTLPEIILDTDVTNNTLVKENITMKVCIRSKYPDFTTIESELKVSNNLGVIKDEELVTMKVGEKETIISSSDDLLAALKDETNWEKAEDGTYFNTLVFTHGGKSEFNIKASDLQGNEMRERSYTAKIDKAAPSFSAFDIDATFKANNYNSYRYFSKDKISFSFKLREMENKVVSVECVAYDVVTMQYKTFKTIELKQSKADFTGTLSLPKNFKGNVTFVATDSAGNQGKKSINSGMIVEGYKKHLGNSEGSISFSGKKGENGFFTGNVKMDLEAADYYSGIKNIVYEVADEKKSVSLKQYEEEWSLDDIDISAKEHPGDSFKVKMTVTDNAGNERVFSKSLKIDNQAPDISVSYDRNSPQHEKYYNSTRTARISIKEFNFDKKSVVITAIKNGSKIDIKPNFSWDGKIQKKDGKVWKEYVMNVPFKDDGDYDLSVEATDLAGNKGSYSKKDTFTIDQTAPKFDISVSGGGVSNGNYYGEARTATITVNEHNFSAADMDVQIKRNGQVVSVGGFSSSGDTHRASVSLNQEGTYEIVVSGKDMAGNQGNSITGERFIIDLDQPVINITGIENEKSYKDKVLPVVTVTDTNFDSGRVRIELLGNKTKEQKVSFTTTSVGNGRTYSVADIEHDIKNDDVYTMKVTATDMAGHESTDTRTFRVNRFGSNFDIDTGSKDVLDKYYVKSDESIVINEYNVDKLKESKVFYSLDGEIVNLEKDKDYKVDQKQDDNGWYHYTYTIDSSAFTKEGSYILSVSSEDAAGNISDNKVSDTQIKFGVDKTAPSVVVTGVTDGQQFEVDSPRAVTIDAFDNVELSELKASVDGAEDSSVAVDKMVDGKVNINLPDKAGNHTLKVSAKDVAGNETEMEYSFHNAGKTADIIPYAIGGGAFIALLGVILAIIMKLKKKA